MRRHAQRRRPLAWLLLAAALLVALAAAASRFTVLLIDQPGRQATVLLPRTAPYGMGLVETEASLCARQGPGSPLHSVHLPPEFCPLAVATGLAAPGRALLELPHWPALRRWAGS